MAKKSDEEKLAEALTTALSSHWFNPSLLAQYLIDEPYYTQDKLMDLMKEIIKVQALRHDRDWEHEQTSEGLIWAARLNETLEQYEPLM